MHTYFEKKIEMALVLQLFKICLSLILFKSLICSEIIPRIPELIDDETHLIEILDSYLKSEEQRISHLEEIHTNFSRLNSIANDNREKFLGHLIDVFLMVRRHAFDWKEVEELMRQNHESIEEILWLITYKPTECD